MSYSQPRDRLELRLKEIIDDQIGDVSDRRTRFDALLAAVVDSSVVPPDQRDRLELYLSELAGRAGGGQIVLTAISLLLGEDSIAGTYLPGAGNAWNRIDVTVDSDVLKAENIRAGKKILGIVGNYAGGSAQLIGGTINLGAAAPTTPLTPPTGYDGFSSVAVTVDSTVIKPENIKAGVTILGVLGTAAGGLTYDVKTATPPIGPVTPVTFNIGWRPDVLVFEWSEEIEDEGETVINYYRRSLTADGSIESDNDTVTFTSTGYTIFMNGTYWNDYPERFGPMTITAIQI